MDERTKKLIGAKTPAEYVAERRKVTIEEAEKIVADVLREWCDHFASGELLFPQGVEDVIRTRSEDDG
jgi:hypothetical protein